MDRNILLLHLVIFAAIVWKSNATDGKHRLRMNDPAYLCEKVIFLQFCLIFIYLV